jgi:hypothetical protein
MPELPPSLSTRSCIVLRSVACANKTRHRRIPLVPRCNSLKIRQPTQLRIALLRRVSRCRITIRAPPFFSISFCALRLKSWSTSCAFVCSHPKHQNHNPFKIEVNMATPTEPKIIPAQPGYSLALPYTRSSVLETEHAQYNAFIFEPIIAWAVQPYYQFPMATRPDLRQIGILPVTARGYDPQSDRFAERSGPITSCPDGSFIIRGRRYLSEIEALVEINRNRPKRKSA